MTAESEPGVDLYWRGGAGGHSVRLNGRVFEAVAARLERRVPCALYHSALEVRVPEGRFVIEQTPIRDSNGRERGGVAEGAVGSRWAGTFPDLPLRSAVLVWGIIPDVDEAVESPQRLTDDPDVAQRVLHLAPYVPTGVWGRDELATGEMWNSNSIIAWLIAGYGLRVAARASGGVGCANSVPSAERAFLAPDSCRNRVCAPHILRDESGDPAVAGGAFFV